eukprot:TRINITY_DN16267_c0_g1_i4.p1 TRINITY_DN16267_c0_g1~~TRINITY_DN16267_c0_g1_i4.p1  ORF type:complete len:212 (-),score=24.26 TRINITY_DN16267_c0_g1_i4:284-919(-)
MCIRDRSSMALKMSGFNPAGNVFPATWVSGSRNSSRSRNPLLVPPLWQHPSRSEVAAQMLENAARTPSRPKSLRSGLSSRASRTSLPPSQASLRRPTPVFFPATPSVLSSHGRSRRSTARPTSLTPAGVALASDFHLTREEVVVASKVRRMLQRAGWELQAAETNLTLCRYQQSRDHLANSRSIEQAAQKLSESVAVPLDFNSIPDPAFMG